MKKLTIIITLILSMLTWTSYGQVGNTIITEGGDEVMSNVSLADYTPFMSTTNGNIYVKPSDGYKQIFILDGDSSIYIIPKASSNNIGEVTVYVYVSTNTLSIDTNTVDSSSVTNLLISTNSATEITFKSPFSSDLWSAYQSTLYYETILQQEPPPAPPVTDGLVFYASYDTDANDEVGSATLIGSGGTYVAGKVGNALSINGTSSQGSLYDGPIIQNGNVDFTISIWVRIDSSSSFPSAPFGMSQSTSFPTTWALDGDNLRWEWYDGPDRFYIFEHGYNQVSIPFTIADWKHIVMVYDTDTMDVYYNGTSIHSFYMPSLDATANLAVGMLYANWAFLGTVDELAIWNRAISESEVGELYNSGAGLPLGE